MKIRQLNYEDRKIIEQMYAVDVCIEEIAERIGCHRNTVYNELQRGMTGKLNNNFKAEYSAEIAQRTYVENLSRRGNRTQRANV